VFTSNIWPWRAPTSGKTSNVNLELFQMIFNNPSNGTYFWEIVSNLRNFPEKK
jgi:hypothetical protein